MKRLQKDPSYPIFIPVFLDATCSGLQHRAGVLHDATLGFFVNLKDQSRNDLYQHVANIVNTKFKASEHHIFSVLKFNRSILKHPIMCIPYSITVYGIAEYLAKEFSYDKNTK